MVAGAVVAEVALRGCDEHVSAAMIALLVGSSHRYELAVPGEGEVSLWTWL